MRATVGATIKLYKGLIYYTSLKVRFPHVFAFVYDWTFICMKHEHNMAENISSIHKDSRHYCHCHTYTSHLLQILLLICLIAYVILFSTFIYLTVFIFLHVIVHCGTLLSNLLFGAPLNLFKSYARLSRRRRKWIRGPRTCGTSRWLARDFSLPVGRQPEIIS